MISKEISASLIYLITKGSIEQTCKKNVLSGNPDSDLKMSVPFMWKNSQIEGL